MTPSNPFPQTSETSARLSLLLQDGTADPVGLASLLVDVYYAPIHRLSAALSGQAGDQAACQAMLVEALLDAHRFRQAPDLAHWFYRNALNILVPGWNTSKANHLDLAPGQGDSWLHLLPSPSRLPALLHYLAGQDAAQIARLLRLDPAQVRELLAGTVRKLARAGVASLADRSWDEIHRAGYAEDERPAAELLDGLLAQSLCARYPGPDAGPLSGADLALEISRTVAQKLLTRRRTSRLQQAGLAGTLMLVSAGLLIAFISGQMAAPLASPPLPTAVPTRQITIQPEEVFVSPQSTNAATHRSPDYQLSVFGNDFLPPDQFLPGVGLIAGGLVLNPDKAPTAPLQLTRAPQPPPGFTFWPGFH